MIILLFNIFNEEQLRFFVENNWCLKQYYEYSTSYIYGVDFLPWGKNISTVVQTNSQTVLV